MFGRYWISSLLIPCGICPVSKINRWRTVLLDEADWGIITPPRYYHPHFDWSTYWQFIYRNIWATSSRGRLTRIYNRSLVRQGVSVCITVSHEGINPGVIYWIIFRKTRYNNENRIGFQDILAQIKVHSHLIAQSLLLFLNINMNILRETTHTSTTTSRKPMLIRFWTKISEKWAQLPTLRA